MRPHIAVQQTANLEAQFMGTKAHVLEAERARRGFAPQDPDLDRRVRALQRPSTVASLSAFVLDWAVIITLGALSWEVFRTIGVSVLSVAAYAVAVLINGSRQKGIENLMHEGTHFNLSPSRRLNDRLALLLGGVWLAPGWTPESERKAHVGGHHENFGNPEMDAEFFTYQRIGLGRLPSISRARSLHLLVLAFMRTTWWRIHSDARGLTPLKVIVILAVWTLLALGGLAVPILLYWYLPYFVVYLPMRFLAEASEHMALGLGSEFATTRNKIGWFQRFVMHPHGDGYHLAHHMYPRIPHQHLARAHRLLMRDPIYRDQGHHARALAASWRPPTTLGEMLVRGRPSL